MSANPLSLSGLSVAQIRAEENRISSLWIEQAKESGVTGLKFSKPSNYDIERVARAMCAADGCDPDHVVWQTSDLHIKARGREPHPLWMTYSDRAEAALFAKQLMEIDNGLQAGNETKAKTVKTKAKALSSEGAAA